MEMVGRHCGTRFAALLLALCFALFLNAPSAWADDAKPMRGVALVIGESRYEQLTTLPSGAPADATYEALKDHFDESGIAELTMAVATINAWNRLGVGMQPILP